MCLRSSDELAEVAAAGAIISISACLIRELAEVSTFTEVRSKMVSWAKLSEAWLQIGFIRRKKRLIERGWCMERGRWLEIFWLWISSLWHNTSLSKSHRCVTFDFHPLSLINHILLKSPIISFRLIILFHIIIKANINLRNLRPLSNMLTDLILMYQAPFLVGFQWTLQSLKCRRRLNLTTLSVKLQIYAFLLCLGFIYFIFRYGWGGLGSVLFFLVWWWSLLGLCLYVGWGGLWDESLAKILWYRVVALWGECLCDLDV